MSRNVALKTYSQIIPLFQNNYVIAIFETSKNTKMGYDEKVLDDENLRFLAVNGFIRANANGRNKTNFTMSS